MHGVLQQGHHAVHNAVQCTEASCDAQLRATHNLVLWSPCAMHDTVQCVASCNVWPRAMHNLMQYNPPPCQAQPCATHGLVQSTALCHPAPCAMPGLVQRQPHAMHSIVQWLPQATLSPCATCGLVPPPLVSTSKEDVQGTQKGGPR